MDRTGHPLIRTGPGPGPRPRRLPQPRRHPPRYCYTATYRVRPSYRRYMTRLAVFGTILAAGLLLVTLATVAGVALALAWQMR